MNPEPSDRHMEPPAMTITRQEFERQLSQGIRELGLKLSAPQRERFFFISRNCTNGMPA